MTQSPPAALANTLQRTRGPARQTRWVELHNSAPRRAPPGRGDSAPPFDHDARVTPFIRTSVVLSLSLAAPWGCSSAGSSGDDVPRFQGAGPAAPGTSGTSAAPSPSGTPDTSPTPPGGEQPPMLAGVDTGGVDSAGATPAGEVGAAPGAPGSADPAAQTPQSPVVGAGSAGCGAAQGAPASDAVANTFLSVPPGYDGTTPVPLVFAFHGANRTNLEQRTVDSRTVGSELEANYVVAYMKSAGSAWDLGADYPRFEAALEQIEQIACVDTEHLFAFGHSSGAQFIVQMLGDNRARETRFAAVAPVSSSRYGNPAWSPVPTLLIHGENDTARPGDNDGAQDIAQYAESNQCAGATVELAVPSCASIAGAQYVVDPGCVEYSGCAAPTLFCRHDDPNYFANGNPTNHGWPCFANSQIFAFFESQR